MLRVARGYVPSHQIAGDVFQETWIGVLKGISKLKAAPRYASGFTVMINIAKTRGVRERRDADAAFTGGTVDSARFRPAGDRWPGHWRADAEPSLFPETPEGCMLGDELVAVARRELDTLTAVIHQISLAQLHRHTAARRWTARLSRTLRRLRRHTEPTGVFRRVVRWVTMIGNWARSCPTMIKQAIPAERAT
jgi:DNA-directed RNA polymerase specialized sigma24 family protein